MTTTIRLRRAGFATVLTALLAGPAPMGAPQEARSSPLAREVVKLLEQSQLAAIAAKDPDQPDRFVAALYIPGVQLLVIAARYSAPSLLNERIWKKEYREVYIDLSSASVPESKTFIEDGGADGLRAERGNSEPLDQYENGATRVAFDHEWRKKEKLSEAAYLKAFGDADERYAQMLQVLIAELKKKES
jgi:hypothetical protein